MGFLFVLKRIGYFALDNWRVILPVIAIAVLLLWVAVHFGCQKSKPITIDQQSLNKINSENRKEREKELQKVIEDNSDVVKTVDNRSAISETNTIERNRLIDERVKEADKKIEDAKQQGRDVTQQELECILVPEHCQ